MSIYQRVKALAANDYMNSQLKRLKRPVGNKKFASLVIRHEYENAEIDYHTSLKDAIDWGNETSAWHNSAYAWNGSKWVRKHSQTEPRGGSFDDDF